MTVDKLAYIVYHPPMIKAAHLKQINPSDFTAFVVTGKLTNGQRFKPMRYSGTYAGAMTAMSINLWNGNVWGILPNGKRIKLKSVTN